VGSAVGDRGATPSVVNDPHVDSLQHGFWAPDTHDCSAPAMGRWAGRFPDRD
jgi:hypothetical protein